MSKNSKSDKMTIIYCLYPDSTEAKKTASLLLKKGKVICANIVKDVESLYMWQGKLQRSKEVAVYFKTLTSFSKEVQKEIVKLHSYDVPFVAELKVEAVNKEYQQYAKKILRST